MPLVALAPMSGVTDVPFRAVARRFGNPLIYSEMVASGPFVARRMDDCLRAEQDTPGAPLIVQLAGCDPHWIAEAAKCAEANGAVAVDLNMGCPSKKVTGGQAGSALMRDTDHAAALIASAVNAVSVPVTVKMRLGWDSKSMNAPILAAAARDLGVRRVAVHGRTRCQFYEGAADWRAVQAVAKVQDICVLVNGDIADLDDARTALQQSGASGVMIGRGAIGQPWLLGQVRDGLSTRPNEPPTRDQVRDIILEHMELSASFYGSAHGLKVFRKHLSAYLGKAGARRSAVALACQQESMQAMKDVVCRHFNAGMGLAAA